MGGVDGQICIAVVLGVWRRVEILHRRVLEPGLQSHGTTELAEVHEAAFRITHEDQSQPVQLIVFQVGADVALEEMLQREASLAESRMMRGLAASTPNARL